MRRTIRDLAALLTLCALIALVSRQQSASSELTIYGVPLGCRREALEKVYGPGKEIDKRFLGRSETGPEYSYPTRMGRYLLYVHYDAEGRVTDVSGPTVERGHKLLLQVAEPASAIEPALGNADQTTNDPHFASPPGWHRYGLLVVRSQHYCDDVGGYRLEAPSNVVPVRVAQLSLHRDAPGKVQADAEEDRSPTAVPDMENPYRLLHRVGEDSPVPPAWLD